jgi:predicted AlkP superfamily pyrophosphatase or phosphodiesterase
VRGLFYFVDGQTGSGLSGIRAKEPQNRSDMKHQVMKKQLLVLINLLLAVSITVSGCSPGDSAAPSNTGPNPLLLISIDGFINEYVERNETPNFDRLIREGVKAEYMIPVFPTKTFPNHFTMVTGLYPENHGIIANNFYDEKLDAQFSFGPVDSPNDERWWGGEPIWITAEKQGLTATTFFWPGSEASYNGVQPTRWVQYDGSVPHEARIDSVMNWLDPDGPVQAHFSTLYFSLVDSEGHEYGPNSNEVDRSVQEMDRLLGVLLDEVQNRGLQDELNIILTSDHGMSELSEERVIVIDEMISMDDVRMIDWTPVAMIQPDSGKTNKVYQTLKENEENYRVYRKSELPDRYHFSDHYRIPEIIMIADDGYTIITRERLEERGVMGGTHGFDHELPSMRTIFVAMGPDFKTGEVAGPFQSIHLYELMSNLLNLEPAPNDGSFEEVKTLLKSEAASSEK